MKLLLAGGSTSVIAHVFMPDSTSTTGAGKTGLVFGDFTVYYVRAGGTLTLLTTETIAALGTYAAPTSAAHIRIALLSDANAPGLYEVQFHNSQLAAGANQATFMFRAAGAAPTLVEIQLAGVLVGSVATDAITAAAIAADAIGSSELAASAAAEIAAAAWAYATRTLTMSAAAVAAAVAGSTITITIGDSLSASITGLGSLAGHSKIWFTVKRTTDAPEASALLQVEHTAGTTYIAGAAATPAQAALGTLTVDDEAAGNITIAVDETITALLTPWQNVVYSIKWLTLAGTATTLSAGPCDIVRYATWSLA